VTLTTTNTINASKSQNAPTADHAAGIPAEVGSAGQGGCIESGNAAPAPAAALKGGALAKLAGMWCNEAGFHTWLADKWHDTWARYDSHTGDVPNNEIAGKVLRELLTVKTRAEIDHNTEAAALFKRLILQPYADHLKATKA